MRGRYLATDFFIGRSKPHEKNNHHYYRLLRQSHLHFPSPDLPPTPPCGLPSFPGLAHFLPLSLDLERLPIDTALCCFLSDVIPEAIGRGDDCRFGGVNLLISENVEDLLREDEEVSARGVTGLWIPKGNGSSDENHVVFQFEIPEMGTALFRGDNESSRAKIDEWTGIHLPLIDMYHHTSTNELGCEIPYPEEAVKSLYYIEDFHDVFDMVESRSSSGEISCSKPVGKIIQQKDSPLFEISEIGLDNDTYLSTKEAFDFLVLQLRQEHRVENEDIFTNSVDFRFSGNTSDLENCPGSASADNGVKTLKSLSLESILELELICLKDIVLIENNSAIYPASSTEDSLQQPCSIQFQEVQILDCLSFPSYEAFGSLLAKNEKEELEKTFRNDSISAGEFYDFIVSSELAPVDEAFKSLPTPVIFYDIEKISSCAIFEKVLARLDPYPMSACDGIYLDWHLLLENTCSREICYTFMDMLTKVNGCSVATDDYCGQEISSIDICFLGDCPEGSIQFHDMDVPLELPVSHHRDATPQTSAPDISSDDQKKGNTNGEILPKMGNKNVSSVFESMSQHNDLKYFLDVRRSTSMRNKKDANIDETDEKAPLSFGKNSVPGASNELTLKQWDIEVLQLCLSDDMLSLIDAISKCYLHISQQETNLKATISPITNIEVLRLSKGNLLEMITESNLKKPPSACTDEKAISFIILYMLKQLTFYLCFFGIHSSYLYIKNFSQCNCHLSIRARAILLLLEDARRKVDKELIESHPSLSIIEEILRKNTFSDGKKILIVADQIFWLALKQKLSSMKMPFHEVRPTSAPLNRQHMMENGEFTNYILEALLHYNCLIISCNKFDIILEYGGPHSLSRIPSIYVEVSLPRVFFISMNLNECGIPNVLCKDFTVIGDHDDETGIPNSLNIINDRANCKNIMDLLFFVPLEEMINFPTSFEYETKVDPDGSTWSIPNSANAKAEDFSMSSFPKTIIIFNTQATEKEMLMSRRSSYQKVLALEKGGLQVVERNIGLPVDIIFSVSICLMWYNSRNIGSNKPVEGSSCIATYMETIATNVLMSLSYSFKSCIVVFEGESNFLATVMESSDALYAAAASLDMHLQLFYSYSPEATDEIILSCIKHTTKSCEGLYPQMLESETLAESFLVKFPSINPLSAHMILSSVGNLVEFLKLSHDLRIQAIGKYGIPDESISLFSTLCRYGELGESKSEMTDCSSIDSDINSSKVQSQNKRQKCSGDLDIGALQMDDLLCVESLSQANIGTVHSSEALQPNRSRHCVSAKRKLQKTKDTIFSLDDRYFGEGVQNACVMEDLDSSAQSNLFNHHENFTDDIINCNHSILDKNISPHPMNLSRRSEYIGKAIKHSFIDGNLGIDVASGTHLPTFPELHDDREPRLSLINRNKSSKNNYASSCSASKRDILLMVQNEQFPWDNTVPKHAENTLGLYDKEKFKNTYGENLFSNSIQSSKFCKESPWMVKFFNKVKENKMPSHHACNTYHNSINSPGNKTRVSRSRSPSLIDSFRYQGEDHVNLKPRLHQKKPAEKQVKPEKKDMSILIPTWTPVDKRARQHLSFVKTGNEKQSKLAWTSMRNTNTDCNFRKRCREET